MRVTRHKKDITLCQVLPLPFVLTLVAEVCILLKEKLRHTQVFQFICSNTDSNWATSIKLKVVGSAPRSRTRGEIFIEKTWKQSAESISGIRDEAVPLFGKAWLAVCNWLFSFTFSDSTTLTGLGFGLLIQATEALEPPQSNGLLVELL